MPPAPNSTRPGAPAPSKRSRPRCRVRNPAGRPQGIGRALAALHESDTNLGAAYEPEAGLRLGQDLRTAHSETERLTRQRDRAEESRAENLAALHELEERLRNVRDTTESGPIALDDDLERLAASEAVGAARSVEMGARLALRTMNASHRCAARPTHCAAPRCESGIYYFVQAHY